MPAFPKVSQFKNSLHNIKINNSWRNVPQIYVKDNGNWKPLYSYSWNIGAWSGCSVTCGGGTQTRTVNCKRNDGLVVNDSICTTFVGSKPSTSQSCNTQSCATCYYYNNQSIYGVGLYWDVQYYGVNGSWTYYPYATVQVPTTENGYYYSPMYNESLISSCICRDGDIFNGGYYANICSYDHPNSMIPGYVNRLPPECAFSGIINSNEEALAITEIVSAKDGRRFTRGKYRETYYMEDGRVRHDLYEVCY